MAAEMMYALIRHPPTAIHNADPWFFLHPFHEPLDNYLQFVTMLHVRDLQSTGHIMDSPDLG